MIQCQKLKIENLQTGNRFYIDRSLFVAVRRMKLLRAIRWYVIRSFTDPAYSYPMRNVISIVSILFLVNIGLLYFLAQGVVINEKNQIWGCGIGLIASLLPLYIMYKLLISAYDSREPKTENI
jgi:hypothetical protein